MVFFSNKRKDFSIQPPKQEIANGAFSVIDSANIDFTYANNDLTANLTQTGIVAGTYGDATHIPILVLDIYGRVTGISTTTFSASGISLETNGTPNGNQTLLNLVAGTNMTITDDGLGNITFSSTGGGGSGTVTSVSAGTGMNFTTITTSGSVAIDTTKVPYLSGGFSTGLLKWNGSAWVFDTNTYLTTISGLNISLLTNDSGYITSAALAGYVPTSRNLTINGVTFDLSADRTWTVGDVLTSGSYANPSWITSLAWSKITGAPTIPVVGNSVQAGTGDVTFSASSPSESVTTTLKTNLKTGSFGVTVDGITSIIQIGQVGFVTMNYAGTISGWSISANTVGSIQFDVWKASGSIPTVANTIVAGAYPTLTAAQFVTSTTLTGWTTTFAAGDVFGFYVNSISTLKNATLTLRCTKS